MSELDRLFEAPLGGFVAARDELSRRLRKEGKPEQAAEVAALRKPAVPVWVVNQLARRRRRDVDLLLDAGHRLRAAQAEADPERAREAFAKARDAEREAMRRLREAAEELLAEERGGASEAMVERVLATLRAAAVTEEGREVLALGRLTGELETTGFELAASLVAKRKAAPAKRRPELEAARAELEQARKREREATRGLQAAERRAEEAEAELGEARREAEEASNAVAAAEAELGEARRA
ncbi:MAG: hypothetical protein WD249_04725 [Gaiellaceae bacterium]